MNIAQSQPRNRHTTSRCPCGRAILVILLDDNAVTGNSGECDILVRDAGDLTCFLIHGLDAHAVGGGGDSRTGDQDVLDGIVGPAANGADGEAMPARAGAACECDALFEGLERLLQCQDD